MAAPQAPTNGSSGYTDRKDYDIERQADHDEAQRNRLTNTVTLSSEMFENLYLSPKNQYNADVSAQSARGSCPTGHAVLARSDGSTLILPCPASSTNTVFLRSS